MTWMWWDKNREEEREMAGAGRAELNILNAKKRGRRKSNCKHPKFPFEPPKGPLDTILPRIHFSYSRERADEWNKKIETILIFQTEGEVSGITL